MRDFLVRDPPLVNALLVTERHWSGVTVAWPYCLPGQLRIGSGIRGQSRKAHRHLPREYDVGRTDVELGGYARHEYPGTARRVALRVSSGQPNRLTMMLQSSPVDAD